MPDTALEQVKSRLRSGLWDRCCSDLQERPGHGAGCWNLVGDPVEHSIARTLRMTWALRIPASLGADDLPAMELPVQVDLGVATAAQQDRLAQVRQRKQPGPLGLKAPPGTLPPAEVLLSCCWADQLLSLVRHEGMLSR